MNFTGTAIDFGYSLISHIRRKRCSRGCNLLKSVYKVGLLQKTDMTLNTDLSVEFLKNNFDLIRTRYQNLTFLSDRRIFSAIWIDIADSSDVFLFKECLLVRRVLGQSLWALKCQPGPLRVMPRLVSKCSKKESNLSQNGGRNGTDSNGLNAWLI